MEILNYIYYSNKVYAPVEDDFGFDDVGDKEELDDEIQMDEGGAAQAGNGGDDLYEHWKVQVDANQDPVRIDKYLADKMAYQSRNRIQQAADAGFIHVNGKPVKSNYKVRPNDQVTLMLDRLVMRQVSSLRKSTSMWCMKTTSSWSSTRRQVWWCIRVLETSMVP